MALPLAATLQPIEQPFAVAAEAELLMVYDVDGAAGVTVDFYLDLQSAETASYPTAYVYGPRPISGAPVPADPCAIPVTTADMPGWCTTVGFSTLLLTWLDVASFFWFDPPGDLVIDFTPPVGEIPPDIGQPCPPPEVNFCLPGSTPLAPTLNDGVCPEGAVVWADALDPWDSGLTCWDAPV